MKIKYLSSASVLIQDEDSSLLTDPWFVDGEFYGSWCNYPPCTIKFDELEKIYRIMGDTFRSKAYLNIIRIIRMIMILKLGMVSIMIFKIFVLFSLMIMMISSIIIN